MLCSAISLLCNSLIFRHPSLPWSSSNHLFLKRSSHQSLLFHPIMFFHSFAIQPNILQLKSPIFFHNACHSISFIILTSRWPHYFSFIVCPILYSLLSLHFIKYVSQIRCCLYPINIYPIHHRMPGHCSNLRSWVHPGVTRDELVARICYIILGAQLCAPSCQLARYNVPNLTYPIHSYVRCSPLTTAT